MTSTDTPQTIHLQGVGRVPAVEATDLQVGDQLMYNSGSVSQNTQIVDASPKFFKIHEVSAETGEEYTRKVKKTTLVARVPEEHRRPLGHTAAPATHYRAQVKAPTGDLGWMTPRGSTGWVTVSHGETVEAAVSGLTASGTEWSYFGSVMLDKHGLGYSYDSKVDGRADSVKAMADGATLTAEDGHSFRILPPEPAGAVELDSLSTEEADALYRAEYAAELGQGILGADESVYASATVGNRLVALKLARWANKREGMRLEATAAGLELGRQEKERRAAQRNAPALAAESEKEQQAARTLPTLEGHTITASLQGSMWTVSLHEDGSAVPLYMDKIGDHVNDGPAYAARELIRVREGALKETAALAALDDETLYEVCEYRASTPTGDPVTMTGRDARARLEAARAKAGPERPHSCNTPRFTLEHSGAHWWATTHAYTAAGHRDQWNRRHIAVRPLVVAKAAHLIMEFTGDGCISPVERPSLEAFGPWVRPVPNFPEMVAVHRVACGLHQRPEHEPARTRWEEYRTAYRAALEAAGWAFKTETADGGMVFQDPKTLT